MSTPRYPFPARLFKELCVDLRGMPAGGIGDGVVIDDAGNCAD